MEDPDSFRFSLVFAHRAIYGAEPWAPAGVVDAAIYLFLFWNLYRNWRTIKKNRAAVVLLAMVLTLFLVYALGVSNFGTAIRHRAKMAPILLLLTAGLPYLRRRRRRERKLQMARASQLVPS